MSNKKHYLLVYDPYDAAIDWNAIMPFIHDEKALRAVRFL